MYACRANAIELLAGGVTTVVATQPQHDSFFLSDNRSCMAVGLDGELWVGTARDGIALIRNGRVETSLSTYAIGGDIRHVFVDREGTTWVGNAAGLHRYVRRHARLLRDTVEGLPLTPYSVFIDSRDDAYMAGPDGFVQLNLASGVLNAFRMKAQAFAEDDRGRVWVATADDVGYIEGKAFRPVRDANGGPVTNVWSIVKDAKGHLWAAARGIGIYQITPGAPRRVVDEPLTEVDLLVSSRHGLLVALRDGNVAQFVNGSKQLIRTMTPGGTGRHVSTFLDDGNAVFMGDRAGLVRWRRGQLTRWTNAHGLPGTGAIQQIAPDRFGRLWLMTSSGGILMVTRHQLDATPDGQPQSLRYFQIGILDGIVPQLEGRRFSPRFGLDSRGLLYFATDDSVAVVDPNTAAASSVVPSIVIESASADNQPLDLGTPQRLVAPSRVQFDYTSLSLRSPENIRFRYRLDGYDAAWVEARGARQVTYGTLPPGRYRFHVTGSSSEGVWNDAGAAVAFEIVPRFYDTWWFRGMIVTIVAVAAGGMHRLRVRRLARQMQIAFDARIAERTRIAGDLHDTLLQTIQGSKLVADRALNRPDDSPDMRKAMEQVARWLGQATAEGRAALQSLRATTESGDLAVSLQRAIDECRHDSTVEMPFSLRGQTRELTPAIRHEVYRIGYEAIRNACQHSGARRIEVRLAYGEDLTLHIEDNGVGIDAVVIETGRAEHFGLRGMRERAKRVGATLTIESKLATGTSVTLVVPGRIAFRSS
jgi:signal transduction histidine kinase